MNRIYGGLSEYETGSSVKLSNAYLIHHTIDSNAAAEKYHPIFKYISLIAIGFYAVSVSDSILNIDDEFITSVVAKRLHVRP